MPDLLFGPTPHGEAIAFLKGKPPLAKAVFDQLLPELKALAFTITGVEDLSVQQAVLDKLATLPAGVPWDKLKKQLVNQLHPYLDDAESGGKRALARAELLLRTHGFQAYQASAHAVMKRQTDVFPYWQYKSMEDGRVRPAHAALDNIVLPANHEFWRSHFPPWQWNCRCQCIPLSEDDYQDIQKADEGKNKDNRSILDPDAQQLLTDKRVLVRNGVAWNVSSDAEKGKEGAYSWHPDNLRPDLAALKAKYDPALFAKFQAMAQGHKLESGVTLWDWLQGQALPGGQPVPAPEPAKVYTQPELPLQAKAARRPKAAKPPKPPEPAPLPPEQWPVERTLGGSTGAELVRDPASGKLYVRKRGNSPEHIREEFAADQAYRALGANVPAARLLETPMGPVKLAEHIEGEQLGAWLKKATPAQAAALKAKLGEHFAADALLGNWDVAGMGLDNILVDQAGVPWRIDNGGALRFRAQGAKKTAAEWNEFPEELWTLRDPKLNAQTAGLFGAPLDIFQIGKQIGAIDEKALLAAVPQELHETLSARLGHLRDLGRKAVEMEADRWQAGYADDLTREMLGLRKTGLVKDLPANLIGAAGDVHLVDAQGNPFDHLRSKPAGGAPSTDGYYATLLNAAKSINAHHAKGDTAYNQGKIDAAVAQKAALTKLTKSKDAAQKAKAKHYLALLGGIEQAVGNTAAKVPTVTQFAAPATVTAAQRSLVERLAEYIKTRGGDWKHVAGWAGQQAGSSTSQGAIAYKRFLLDQLDGAKNGDFHRAPAADAWTKYVPAAERESYRIAMLAHHAFVQEALAHTAFATNDVARRRVRILRTETTAQAVPFKVGDKGVYQRGVNESGSLFRPIWSGAKTVTNVPHSHVTSLYFLERHPGQGGSFLLGDSENEATYITWRLETRRVADSYFNKAPGADSTKWEI